MDREHRELERLAASGDLDAAAKLLQERLRAGEISEDGLHLAAYLGHEAALRALPPDTIHVPHETTWFGRIKSYGLDAYTRAALAATGAALTPVEDALRTDPSAREALEAAEALHVCPCSDHEGTCRSIHYQLRPRTRDRSARSLAAYDAAHAVSALCRRFEDMEDIRPASEAMSLAVAAARIAGPEQRDDEWKDDYAMRCAEPLRAAIRADLLPWALGEGDPLRARVEERRNAAR